MAERIPMPPVDSREFVREARRLKFAATRAGAEPFIDPELREMHTAAERLSGRRDVTPADVRAVWALVPEHRLERVQAFVDSLARAAERWARYTGSDSKGSVS